MSRDDSLLTAQAREERLIELALRYWDNLASPAELAELETILRCDPSLRQTFRELAWQILMLGERQAAMQAAGGRSIADFQEALECDAEACDMEACDAADCDCGDPEVEDEAAPEHATSRDPLPCPASPDRLEIAAAAAPLPTADLAAAPETPRTLISRRALLLATASLAGGAAMVAIGLRQWPATGDASTRAELEAADGKLLLESRELAIQPGQSIPAGARFATIGLGSSATLRLPDGSRLRMAGDTAVTWHPATPAVFVHGGDVAVDVEPQTAGKPLQITTPAAEIRVVGTRLAVAHGRERTFVGVLEGEVRMSRTGEAASIALRPGEGATTTRDSGLERSAFHGPPDTLRIDFAAGLPDEWITGELISISDSAGPRSAVRAVAVAAKPLGTHHQIRSQNAWTQGFFEIHPDSVFRFRFRVDRVGFFHVLLVARPENFDKHATVVLEGHTPWMQRTPGVWYEAAIPLADFKQKQAITGASIVFAILIDSQVKDLGLTIEWIEVVRTGSEV